MSSDREWARSVAAEFLGSERFQSAVLMESYNGPKSEQILIRISQETRAGLRELADHFGWTEAMTARNLIIAATIARTRGND